MTAPAKKRRTSYEVRADFETVLANSKKAVSLVELARMSGLTRSQLITTLESFPHANSAIRQTVRNNAMRAGYKLAYVFDTSMLNVDDALFFDIINQYGILICLRPVLDELDRISKTGTDEKAKRAHILMSRALHNPDKYIIEDCSVKGARNVDDSIVRYCARNAHRVILLTADKNMTLKAKAKSVAVKYFLPVIDLPPCTKVREEDGKLVIDTDYEGGQVIHLLTQNGKHVNPSSGVLVREKDELRIAYRDTEKSHARLEVYEIYPHGGSTCIFKQNFPLSLKRARMQLPGEYSDIVGDFIKKNDSKKRTRGTPKSRA